MKNSQSRATNKNTTKQKLITRVQLAHIEWNVLTW